MRSWLAIDIGNTQTVAGRYSVPEPESPSRVLESVEIIRFKTQKDITPAQWLECLAPLFIGPIEQIHVASVVPSLRPVLEKAFEATSWHWLDSRSKIPFELALPHPEQLGADRIANVAGALGRHAPPFVIVDAGTATTFCVVDGRNRYIGGSITPGMETAFHALASKASRLFEVPWARPAQALGNTTETQLQSGIVHAHEALIEGMTARLMAEAAIPQARLLLTGGCANYIRPAGFEFIPTLTLEGLVRIGLLAEARP